MLDDLTKKQKEFVEEYVKTGHGTNSALKAYNTTSENTAANIASENLKIPAIINAIKSIAEQIPDELLVEKHLALLNKTEKKYDSDGNIIHEDIDSQAVGKGLEMAYKVKGTFAPDKTINVNVEIESSDEIRELAKRLDDLDRTRTKSSTSDGGNPHTLG